MEQVLCEFQETVEDRMDRAQAQMEDVLESKEKVLFFVFIAESDLLQSHYQHYTIYSIDSL